MLKSGFGCGANFFGYHDCQKVFIHQKQTAATRYNFILGPQAGVLRSAAQGCTQAGNTYFTENLFIMAQWPSTVLCP